MNRPLSASDTSLLLSQEVKVTALSSSSSASEVACRPHSIAIHIVHTLCHARLVQLAHAHAGARNHRSAQSVHAALSGPDRDGANFNKSGHRQGIVEARHPPGNQISQS